MPVEELLERQKKVPCEQGVCRAQRIPARWPREGKLSDPARASFLWPHVRNYIAKVDANFNSWPRPNRMELP